MVKYIALHSLVPLRREPSEKAEMETQMLFAQTCTLLDEQPRWLQVRIDDDGAIGWADKKMLTPLPASSKKKEQESEEAFDFSQHKALVSFPLAYALSLGNGQTIPLTAGTRLPNYKDGRFSIAEAQFQIDPQFVITEPLTLNLQNLQLATRFFLNTPYLWGGKSALGIDCSGFTQVIMSLFGIGLPRNASQQVLLGSEVADINCAQAGDLAFFRSQYAAEADNSQNSNNLIPTHVGILLTPDTIIHSSGRVKIEKIDSYGIKAIGTNEYTHQLLSIRRI